ncbi:NAD-dependent epimerase/dehydratase family protein [Rhodovulum adriaticum]|uniref:Nucleoside-diphosphate-sugar epimerase n=1 Tax=Rhodovulum adriaticum TaxID=35804 RepID=A0A4R2NTY8_RHOAD|nr:NAD-dependent epimerase/dehydratase family protein [Rhodovulum adriaticum]MBK1635020.1 hypothetical protein [Rhodovulum adriaticum]TCP25347.1 nucleoside-diphosphate-sugar epimerase [Rhodovulum adriaticum]
MRALISDVCGPLGKRVAERLLAAGYEVTGLASPEEADRAPEGVRTGPWPKTPGRFGRRLARVSLVVIPDFATPPEEPEQAAADIAGLIAAADKAGVARIVLVNSAAVYDPVALQSATVDENGPFVSAQTADPLARAAIALERALSDLSEDAQATVLRCLPVLSRDCPAARAAIRDMWRTGQPQAGLGRLHPVDVDELADMVLAAAERPGAAGLAFNLAGPVAVGADSAAAECQRLGKMLLDDTDTTIRVRPVYPEVPPVLNTARAVQVLGFRPRKRVWVNFAEILQEVIRRDRDGGLLPPVRSSLPPALTAVEAGQTPLAGKHVVVTEAATPATRELVSLLLRLGAHLHVVTRPEDAAALQARFGDFEKAGKLDLLHGDIALMGDVRRIAGQLCQTPGQIDLLFNTVLRLHDTREETAEGHERSVAANLLGQLLLTDLLAGPLQAAQDALVVNVVNNSYADCPVDPDDLESRIVYAPLMAMGRAQAALMMCGFVLSGMTEGSGIRVATLVPRAERSETWRLPPLSQDNEMLGAQERQRRETLRNRAVMQMTSPRDVASHIADLAVQGPEVVRNGGFFVMEGQDNPVPHVLDQEIAERLWQRCLALADATPDAT